MRGNATMTSLFDTRRSLRRAGIALTAGASLFAMAGAAFAAPIPLAQLTSVHAAWGPLTGGTGVVYNPVGGGSTAEVRWGNTNNNQNPNNIKSGYEFAGAPTSGPAVEADDDFHLGDFTHFNYPIGAGSSITAAVLTLTFGVTYSIDNGGNWVTPEAPIVLKYRFDHDETSNGSLSGGVWGNPTNCANGPNGVGINDNGCSDNVKVGLVAGQDENFAFKDADGHAYFLSITGFVTGLGGAPVNDFWTRENDDTQAQLWARFTADPNVAPIPLPAAAWMLIGGLGALGAVARRRKAAAAA